MTLAVRMAVLGFALGWVIAVAGACGGGDNKACGPGTCNGCCDADGVCQQGTLDNACGANGASCNTCTARQSCVAGACSTGGVAGNAAAFTAWCDTFSTSYCHAFVTCKRLSAADESKCVKVMKDMGCYQSQDSIVRGYSTFDEAAGQNCLSQLQESAASCMFGFSCDVAVAASGPGEGCLLDVDCVGSNLACGGPACNQTCQAPGGLNQPCRNGRYCDLGLVCDSMTNTCGGPKPLGSTCNWDDECGTSAYCSTTTYQCTALPTAGEACLNYPCAAGNYCDGTICKVKVVAGASCSGWDDCVDSAFCNINVTPSVCATRKPAGSLCTSSTECQQGTFCDGICKPLVNEGGACNSYMDCAVGLWCDGVTRTCASPGSASQGESCTGDVIFCDWDLACHGVATNPDGGVGTTGTCQVPALGDACTGGYSCPSGAYCKMPTDGGWQGFCTASSLEAPCSENNDCQTGQYCKGSSFGVAGTCATQEELAQPCDVGNSGSCVAPYACIWNGSVAVCGERVGTGEACADSSACMLFNECRNNVCTAVAFEGQPCSSFGVCYDSACVGRVADDANSGTCSGKRAEGESCYTDGQCQNSSCLQYTCTTCP